MAADLSIHVLEGADERDLALFNSNTLGSRYFNPVATLGRRSTAHDEAHRRIGETPQIWIGEVSWLKAALLEGGEQDFVPGVVQAVQEAIGQDLPMLDDALLLKIKAAWSAGNATAYSVASWKDVEPFLREHMGKRLFTVSW